MKTPGPDHPISIALNQSRVVVEAGGRTIADTSRALLLREANYPPVYYVPREDVDMSMLMRTDRSTHCPYKGDCSYFSIASPDGTLENVVWSYENPFQR